MVICYVNKNVQTVDILNCHLMGIVFKHINLYIIQKKFSSTY